ncbi:hypothetical protein ATY77_00970 [Rhizobium sp. R634]|nr:hypothetical protein ATY77_00970 [Rhizobium sp. R634]
MNKGNTDGEYCYVRSTDVKPPPNATDGQNKAWYDGAKKAADDFWAGMKATSDEAALLDGAVKRTGEWINDPSKIVSDAKGLYDSLPTGAEIWQGAQNIGSGLLHMGEQVVNDPIGSAKSAGGWAVDQVEGAIDSVGQGYEKHGMAGATGAGVGVLASIFSPGKKIKALKHAGEALEEVGDAASAIHKAERIEDAAGDAHVPRRNNPGESTDGKDGARVTHKLHVRCFELPKGVKRDEFRRQLEEQQDTINKMTADDMAYAHKVLDHAREAWEASGKKGPFTNLLRDGKAQDAVRADYRRSLESAGLSEADIEEEMSRVNATHYLDMIAGGDPADLGIGGGAENQRIGPMWAQKGRAESVKEMANKMRSEGKAGSLMDVELKICGE